MSNVDSPIRTNSQLIGKLNFSLSRLNSHQLEQSRGELRFESRPVDFVWFPYDLRIGTIADKNSANWMIVAIYYYNSEIT